MTTQSNLSTGTLGNGHDRRRQLTRAQLLAAGRQLFLERDPSDVSIDAITGAAGVAKGSFYNHFESRQALLDEVIAQTLEQVLTVYEELDRLGLDDLAGARVRSNRAFATLLGDPAACQLMLRAGPAAPDGPIDRVLRSALGDALDEAIARGSLRHLDDGLVYRAYFAVITETIGHLLQAPQPPDPDKHAPQLTQLCFAVLGLPVDGPSQQEMSS